MKRTFIMTPVFDNSWAAMGLDDADLVDLQNTLLVDPEAGDVIPGTGGARKIRVKANSHG